MASSREASYLQNILTKDPNLLKDAMNFSLSDVLNLTRRLEAAAKTLAEIASSLNCSSSEVSRFITELVFCFLAISDTTKMSKGLEKMLIATGVNCQDLVKRQLREQLTCSLKSLSASGTSLKRVSCLLEHSKLIQELLLDFMPVLLEQLQNLFSELKISLKKAPVREEEEKTYYTIKLCLQLFQLMPQMRRQGFFHLLQLAADEIFAPGLANPSNSLSEIVKGILCVLIKNCYSRDITLLAGTAVAMVISAAPTPEQSAQCFFSLYSILKKGGSSQKLAEVQPREALNTNATPGQKVEYTSEIAVLRGIIVGTSPDLLCCIIQKLSAISPQLQPFLLSLFPLVCELCDSGTEYQYLTFQILSQWIKKLHINLSVINLQKTEYRLMSKDSEIITETLKRIWVNWDSPVEGVSEFVGETFKVLLEVWQMEVASGRSDHIYLAEELLSQVIQMPWYSRCRYKPLCLLIPHVNTDKLLSKFECLKQDLVKCMGTSFLTAVASDVYSAFLHSIRNNYPENEHMIKWRNTWLPCVMSGLTIANSLIKTKVCAYWLPATLKILSDTGSFLQQHLEQSLQAADHSQRSQLLFAWIAVCRNLRTVAELDLRTLPEMLLAEAVYSDDEDTCAEALSLLSATRKKAEPLGEIEMRIFHAVLPYCLKVDSAPFRQKLAVNLRKVFVRVRDSCFTAIKRKIQAEFIDSSLQFVDWLYNLMMINLVPGSCFQRRQTCLDIIQGCLEIIIFVEKDGAKKGKAQGPTHVLISYAQKKGWWDFFSFRNKTSLLHCVCDGADEIQESAVHVLSKYFLGTSEEISSTMITTSNENLFVHILLHGLELCNSPRAYENHSGALLIRFFYEKFVRDQGYYCEFHEDRENDQSAVPVSLTRDEKQRHRACSQFFSKVLLRKIQSSLKSTEVDALFASKHDPTHGMVQAMCECLRLEQTSPSLMDPQDWQKILTMSINLNISTITFVLHMLAGGKTGNCPSFAEMGIALEQVLAGEDSVDQEVTSSLSPEFQLLLSWCWLNLKESSTCLGLVVALATKGSQNQSVAFEHSVIESVGNTFIQVLTFCRHRGAIEGSRNGFLQFCTSLISCEDSSFSSIPGNILNQVLSGLEKDEMMSSVTRRSAGLPIIVQTIVQAEKRCKLNSLLHQAVRRLSMVAMQPPSKQTHHTQDQAPVHALNVLKALFSDASLSVDLLNHLGHTMQLVIHCFESSSWAVRNAATQLVSTLVTRMFGQRNKASLSCNMMTLQEFSAHFPELLAFVNQKLDNCIQAGVGVEGIQPSLFLILTLLASLGPAVENSQSHRLASHLRSIILDAASSPVYYLRELIALAVVALTPLDETQSCVKEILDQLSMDSSSFKSSNSIHGYLMCLDKLLTSRRVSLEVAQEIMNFALGNTELISPSELCPLVCAKFVDILGRVTPLLVPDSPLTEKLLGVLYSILISPRSSRHLQVGMSLYTKSSTSVIFGLLQSLELSALLSLESFVLQCLLSQDVELRSAVLDCIVHRQEVLSGPIGARLLECLWHHLQGETDMHCVLSICNIVVAECLKQFSPISLHIGFCLNDVEALRCKFEKLACVQAAILPVEAVVLVRQLEPMLDITERERLLSTVCEWSHRLLNFSQPCQNEDFRMAAAQALSLAGQQVLSCFAQWHSENKVLEPAVVSLVQACIMLLEETDCDIRAVVTRFISNIQWSKRNPKICHVNSNICTKLLLCYLHDELGHCQVVYKLLFNKLFTSGDLSTCLTKLTGERVQHLFEHEENTFFSEKILLQVDIFEILKSLTTGTDQADVLPGLLAELRAALPTLHSNAARNPVFNLLGETEVVTALTGLVMQIHLLISATTSFQESHQSTETQLYTESMMEVEKLFKIPSLHPVFSTLLYFNRSSLVFTSPLNQALIWKDGISDERNKFVNDCKHDCV